jgi:hypothetical protein
VHTHSYNSLSSSLHTTYGAAAADWLLEALTSINLKTNTAFISVFTLYLANTLFSCAWLIAGGGSSWRAMFIILQTVGYPLYTLYCGYIITRTCLPPSTPPLPFPFSSSSSLPQPEGPLAVSLLLTEFVSFNVLDPQKVIVMRDRAAAAAAAAAAAGGEAVLAASKKTV